MLSDDDEFDDDEFDDDDDDDGSATAVGVSVSFFSSSQGE